MLGKTVGITLFLSVSAKFCMSLVTYFKPKAMKMMTKYNENDLQYKGESNGVHSWSTPSGQPYYWHPDWLHIAEDATGAHPKAEIDVAKDEPITKKHALNTILLHLNAWATKTMSSNPDFETQAHESQMELKK